MLEVQSALDHQKDEFTKSQEDFHEREEQLRDKDQELQESLVKYNRFLQDNDVKRADAEKKYIAAKKEREQKEQEITKLQKDLEQLKQEEQEKKKLLEKHKQYQRYLNSVVEKTEEYKEVKFLIERWRTLKTTSDSLLQATEKSMKETEVQKVNIQKYTEEKANERLWYNNEITKLQKQLEEQMDKSLQEENEIDERANMVVGKSLECSQIKMYMLKPRMSNKLRACDNIFRRILDRNKQKYKKTSTLRQLQLIGMYIEDYKDIAKNGKKISKKE